MRGLFFVLSVLLLATNGAIAEPLLNTPVYNPETKSYFELYLIGQGYSVRGSSIVGINWRHARRFAASRNYKGARGRLAVVRSKSVNDFLRDTFKPDRPAWIGLRYFCEYKRLKWVTGERQTGRDYNNWARPWNRRAVTPHGDLKSLKTRNCPPGRGIIWPVHYWSVQDGFQWNANGKSKDFRLFFIEYPTGKE